MRIMRIIIIRGERGKLWMTFRPDSRTLVLMAPKYPAEGRRTMIS